MVEGVIFIYKDFPHNSFIPQGVQILHRNTCVTALFKMDNQQGPIVQGILLNII